jgi:LPXTG-motif cell wall-anchored protein
VTLARTGFDARIPAAAGLVLLIAGTTLLVRTRRRES